MRQPSTDSPEQQSADANGEPAFLIVDSTTGRHEFYRSDPREGGFDGPVTEVAFTNLDINIEVAEGQPYPVIQDLCLGRSRENPKEDVVFTARRECDFAGFEVLDVSYSEPDEWMPGER